MFANGAPMKVVQKRRGQVKATITMDTYASAQADGAQRLGRMLYGG